MIRALAVILAAVSALWWVWPNAVDAPMRIYTEPDAKPLLVFVKTKADLPPLDKNALRALAVDFPQTGYFGAFAIGRDGHFGWVGNRHDIHTARIGALSRCGDGCEIVLETYPAGYKPETIGRTVSAKLAAAVADRAAAGAASALYYALAPNGAWALQQADETGPLASLFVLNRCRNFLEGTHRREGCTLFHGPFIKSPPP